MVTDTRFATKLDTIDDAPEPLRNVLLDNLPLPDSVGLLIHAPAFLTSDERSPRGPRVPTSAVVAPATVLAVTSDGWLVASETEDGGASVEKAHFHDTLFLELSSILLSGQLRIYFAAVGISYSATMSFDTVGEELYREAIDLILSGIDRTPKTTAKSDRGVASPFEAWPTKFRNEAERYRPKGQRLLAATQWSGIVDGFQRELCPNSALLVTERELVLISEEKTSPRLHREDFQKFGGIITYFPLIRLLDFHVSHHDRFGVLALRVHAVHGGEKLEIIFPADHEKVVAKAMEQVRADKG
jgi:hypothetical protein